MRALNEVPPNGRCNAARHFDVSMDDIDFEAADASEDVGRDEGDDTR
jgi:hypothetical protein